MKKYAKENYYNNLETIISSKDNGNKTFWQVMGRFIGKTNNSTIIPPLRLSDNNYAFTNKEKAECLNDFFCSISSIDDSDNELPNFENRTDSILSNINITKTDVKDILSSLIVNKESGPDGIGHKMLKNTCHTIAKPLKIYALVGNIKNDLVKYFMQHIRNGLFIDLINT